MGKAGRKYYAVARGKYPGIYSTWSECKAQINGVSDRRFKSFLTQLEAEVFMQRYNPTSAIATKNTIYNGVHIVSKLGSELAKSSQTVSTIANLNELIMAQNILNDIIKPNSLALGDASANSLVQQETISVYTDGCCYMHGSKRLAGYGVFFGDNDKRNISLPMSQDDKHTNQRAELMAAIAALESIQATNDHVDVILLTDSRYVIKGITSWIHGWKKNPKRFDTIENKDLFIRLDTAVQRHKGKIEWHKVLGHSNIYGNEQADQLAKQGANSAQ